MSVFAHIGVDRDASERVIFVLPSAANLTEDQEGDVLERIGHAALEEAEYRRGTERPVEESDSNGSEPADQTA